MERASAGAFGHRGWLSCNDSIAAIPCQTDGRVLRSERAREPRRGGAAEGPRPRGKQQPVTACCHSQGGEGSIPLVLWVEKYQLGDLNDSTEATEESAP